MPIPYPSNERKRLEALAHYKILDTPAERSYDDLTLVASIICKTPIALMTLVDENRQWFKARHGQSNTESPREHAFCSYTILGEKVMVVENYIASHSEVSFSHSICPACLKLHFPDAYADMMEKGLIQNPPRSNGDSERR